MSGCGFEMESFGVTLESLEDLYHQNKNLLVGFMLQTMSIYDDTNPLNSLDFKVKTISFNSRNNCFSFHSKSSVQTNVILLKKIHSNLGHVQKKRKQPHLSMKKKKIRRKSKKQKSHVSSLYFQEAKVFFCVSTMMSSRHYVVPHDFILDQYHSTVHITILHALVCKVRNLLIEYGGRK